VAFFEPNIGAGVARFAIAATALLGFVLLVVLSVLRRFDRAIMLLPTWSLLLFWLVAGYMTVTGQADNDIVQPALAGGLIMIILLISFTIIQHAFSGGAFQQNLFSETELQALAIRGSNDIVWDWDVGRDRVTTRPDLGRVIGLGRNALHGPVKNWLQFMHLDDREKFRAALDSVVESGKGRVDLDVRLRATDTRYNWFNIRARPVIGGSGTVIRCIGMTSNISGQKRTEERLLQDAVHDNLTGLPNRSILADRTQMAISIARQSEMVVPTLVVLEIDNYADVIERFGQQGSDNILVTLARRLRIHLQNDETLARLGNDRFGALVLTRVDANAIAGLAENIMKAIKTPTSYAEQEVQLSASIGLATWTPDITNAEALFNDAELALIQAKRYGGDRIEPFRPAFRHRDANHAHLEADLRRALERDEIGLVFQPVFDTQDGQVAGFEATMRWHHPRRGVVPPAEFLGIAENSDLIVPLGNHAMELVAAQLSEWEALGADRSIFVGVNVWPQQLMRPNFASTVGATLAKYPQRKHSLFLEMTETGLMSNPEHNAVRLASVKALGVRLALDDFGSGATSIAYLSGLDIDMVKIDKQLVHSHTQDKAAFLRSIIDLAHALDMQVVTEAAEVSLQMGQLRDVGADFVQSYATSATLTSEEAWRLVMNSKHHPQLVSKKDDRSDEEEAQRTDAEALAAQ
ncbi:MAG: EAL domain-containing protein, partial [Pseudomonadota bacterium]